MKRNNMRYILNKVCVTNSIILIKSRCEK